MTHCHQNTGVNALGPHTAAPDEDTPPPPAAAPSLYIQLLTAAYRLGNDDGRLAADLHLGDDPADLGDTCRGQDADQFARELWDDRLGPPPAGLTANAGPWYLAGFRDGLSASAQRSTPAREASTAGSTRPIPIEGDRR